MDIDMSAVPAKSPMNDAATLCELLLQVAGRDTNRLPSVRRHVATLYAALPFMTKSQAEVARERISRFETKWGPVLSAGGKEPENGEIPPEMRVAQWLSLRRKPERHLMILYRAASCVWGGETSLAKIMDFAYAREIDMVVALVGYDSFSEWLLQLRIAVRARPGVYLPGNLCRWWIEQMEPTDQRDTAYAACMTQLVSLKSKNHRECGQLG